MPTFAVRYAYVSDAAALDAARPAHRAYLGSLGADGRLLGSGPFVGGDAGALIVLSTADEAEARALLAADPFQQAGLVAETDVREWNVILGPWATA